MPADVRRFAPITSESPDRPALRLVALLRGINVGGRNRIAMADLRQLVEDLGFQQVLTHLQSGNVVFDARLRAGRADRASGAAAAGIAIEDEISGRLGLQVPVIVRSRDDLEGIVSSNPLREVATNPSRLLVSFLSRPVDPSLLADLDAHSFAPDAFALRRREVYVWAPNGASETKLTHSFWEKRLKVTATARNWNTVQRLLQLASQ